MRWAFDEQFRQLSSSKPAGKVRDPLGLVAVPDLTEEESAMLPVNKKAFLIKVRIVAPCIYHPKLRRLHTRRKPPNFLSRRERAS